MKAHEPCQVRKKAAVSDVFHVTWGCLSGANCNSNGCGCISNLGVRLFLGIISHLWDFFYTEYG